MDGSGRPGHLGRVRPIDLPVDWGRTGTGVPEKEGGAEA